MAAEEDVVFEEPQLHVEEETWRQKWHRIMEGLKAEKDSGEYKWATMELQRIYGPSSASTAVCTIVMLLLLIFVATSAAPPPPTLQVEMVEPEQEELEEIEEEPIEEPPEITEVDETFEPTQDKYETDAEQIVAEVPSFGDDSTDELVDMSVDIIKSPMVLKGLYGSRVGGGKAHAIRRFGGDGGGGALTAVLKALRWLKRNQNEDGSWTGGGSKTAMCGLALLCYLAHGETPASKEFGQTVEKAIQYLLYAQNASGKFKDCGAHYVYGHGIATYALSEAYGMTKMYMLKEPMEKALQIIIDGQQGGGAWNYDYKKAGRKDLSVSAWQVQALKAGTIAGAGNEGLADALYKAVPGLKSFYGNGFGYTGAGKNKKLTGAGVLGLQLLGHAQDAETQGGLNAFADMTPSWPKEGGGTYGWYYTTQARFQNGGPLWKKWNDAMLPMLVKNQEADGHWESRSTHRACDVYDTTLCCLSLEVYYRYLPTFVRSDDTVRKPKGAKDDMDMKITIEKIL